MLGKGGLYQDLYNYKIDFFRRNTVCKESFIEEGVYTILKNVITNASQIVNPAIRLSPEDVTKVHGIIHRQGSLLGYSIDDLVEERHFQYLNTRVTRLWCLNGYGYLADCH